ncbi:hypothetical protein ACIQGZ_11840 [Streptomyces sp. NPDC092296]|uniref:hypothetical protein n=1 Tax=Streptomyces sp. NPDC092296 TaxID=3366012 RepID=UPI0037F823CE
MSHTPPQPPPIPPGPPPGPPTGPRRSRRARIGALTAGAVVLLAAAGGGLYLLLRPHDAAPAAAPSPPPPSTAPASPPPTPSDTPDLPYVLLTPGTCFDHPNLTKGLRKVVERPCDKPHDGEAVANVTIKGKYAHDSEIANAVRKQCTTAGKATADRQAEGSHYYSYVLTPSVALYHQGYDKATCTLTASYTVGGKKLTSKLR